MKATSDPKYEEELQLEKSRGEVHLGADVFLLHDAIKNISTDLVRCKFMVAIVQHISNQLSTIEDFIYFILLSPVLLVID